MHEMFSSHGLYVFLGMVFVAVFLLINSLIVPAFGAERQQLRRLRKRMTQIVDEFDESAGLSLLREKQLRTLSPLERSIMGLPGMATLHQAMVQVGYSMPAYRLVLLSLGLGAAAGIAGYLFMQQPLVSLAGAAVAGYLPIMMVLRKRDQQLAKFEEQLPEALDVITRALKAGHPFTESLQLVAEEMEGPVAKQFGMTFNDINYGTDIRAAFLYLLERVPSMSLMTAINSVLIQRETGGNLAEILEKNSQVVRGRFRFQRRVRTLSAEGRMSAWVLTLIPFGLFALLMLTSPDYLPVLVKDPRGPSLIAMAFFMMAVGIYWMRRIIRIDV